MSNLNYQLLGRSGLRVSDLCLGTMTFGEDWGWGAAKDEARKIYDNYREAGGNFIDTANIYTNGSSEKLVGEFIAAHREEVVLATKYTNSVAGFSGQTGTDANAGGNQRKNMVQAVEASLKRLGTDYIDLYWLHIWDQLTPVEEVMRGFDDLVRAGKVLYVGILRRAGLGRGEIQHPGRTARLDPLRRLADRIQPAGAHGRAGTRPDGPGPTDDRAGLVAPAQWLAHRQVPAGKRETIRGGRRTDAQRDDEGVRFRRGGDPHDRPGGRGRRQGTGRLRGASRARLAALPSGPGDSHHRRAQTLPARGQHSQPGRDAFDGTAPATGQGHCRVHGFPARLHGFGAGPRHCLRRHAGPDQSLISIICRKALSQQFIGQFDRVVCL